MTLVESARGGRERERGGDGGVSSRGGFDPRGDGATGRGRRCGGKSAGGRGEAEKFAEALCAKSRGEVFEQLVAHAETLFSDGGDKEVSLAVAVMANSGGRRCEGGETRDGVRDGERE